MAQFRMVLVVATIWVLTVHTTNACPSNARDLIDCNTELAQVIAPALTEQEQATVTEAMFRRQQQEAQVERSGVVTLDPHMAMAYAHVTRGGKLRVGDIVALHGAVLSALRPDTYALAKKWQALLTMYAKCKDDITCAWF